MRRADTATRWTAGPLLSFHFLSHKPVHELSGGSGQKSAFADEGFHSRRGPCRPFTVRVTGPGFGPETRVQPPSGGHQRGSSLPQNHQTYHCRHLLRFGIKGMLSGSRIEGALL